MPYLNLDPNYPEHPKTRRLASWLGDMADAMPVRLWAYCARIHPKDGIMRGYSAVELEACLSWRGDPNKLVDAFLAVGFLKKVKNGFACVDWEQHQGHLEAFSRRGAAAAKARWDKYASSIPEALDKQCKQGGASNAPAVPTIPTNQTIPDGFAEFWGIYPKHVKKAKALAIWKKLKVDAELLQIILAAIKAQAAERASKLAAKEFAPEWANPDTWLNGARWEDETSASVVDAERQQAIARTQAYLRETESA